MRKNPAEKLMIKRDDGPRSKSSGRRRKWKKSLLKGNKGEHCEILSYSEVKSPSVRH